MVQAMEEIMKGNKDIKIVMNTIFKFYDICDILDQKDIDYRVDTKNLTIYIKNNY